MKASQFLRLAAPHVRLARHAAASTDYQIEVDSEPETIDARIRAVHVLEHRACRVISKCICDVAEHRCLSESKKMHGGDSVCVIEFRIKLKKIAGKQLSALSSDRM